MTNPVLEEAVAKKIIRDRKKQLEEHLIGLQAQVYACQAAIGELEALLNPPPPMEEKEGNKELKEGNYEQESN